MTTVEKNPLPARWRLPEIRLRLWHEVLIVTLVVLCAMGIRLQDLHTWRQASSILFHQGEPMLSTLDAPFYLTLARDLSEGTYAPVDTMRAVPDFPLRPTVPPLLSVMTAAVHAVTPFSWAWIAAILPIVLGSLAAVPMYLLARLYGGPMVAATAALVTTLAPVYVSRTGLAWFDTDVMNVSWTLLIAWCLHRFAFLTTRARYAWAAAGLGCAILFLWWWDQASHVVVALTAGMLATAILFFYRPPRREGVIFLGVCAGLMLATLAWLGFDLPVRVGRAVVQSFGYISKAASDGPFPNIGVSISEQVRPSVMRVVSLTMAHWAPFLVGAAGLVWLAVRERRRSLMLLVPALLGALTFFAMRFAIFLVPLLGLGAGVVAGELWRLRARFVPMYAITPVAVAALLWPLVAENLRTTIQPRELAPYVAGMTPLVTRTPGDAVVWAWWDHGYNINFWARRATVNDGSVHDGERSVYNALPMATDSYRLAANFMRFYVVRGKSGLQMLYRAADDDPAAGFRLVKQVLAEGPDAAGAILGQASLAPAGPYQHPEDWLEFFFPETAPPVYLFIDQYTYSAAYWWYWYGTWDIAAQSGTHPQSIPIYRVRRDGETRLSGGHGISVDLDRGVVNFARRSFRPSQFSGSVTTINRTELALGVANYHSEQGTLPRRYTEGGYRLDYAQGSGFATISTPDLGASVFNQLFAGLQYDAVYFRPVLVRPGIVQVWEVTGDTRDSDPGAR